MRTASCPSWCTTRHADWDVEPDGHDGPREFGTVSVGLTVDDPLGVYSENVPQMTPDQAREFACNLYRAAAWVEDHRDD
jgi:hypothetical protein